MSDGVPDADPGRVADVETLGDDPPVLTAGLLEPVDVAPAVVGLGQPPEGEGAAVCVVAGAWLVLGLGEVVAGFGVRVAVWLALTLGLLVALEVSVAIGLLVALVLPLAVLRLVVAAGLLDRTDGLVCATALDELAAAAGDDEHVEFAAGVPPPADAPPGPALPSAAPPPVADGLGAGPCELTPTV